MSQASQTRQIGTDLAPSLSQTALEFSTAWGEKGRSFTLSSCGHLETWPADSQRAEHPKEGSQSNRQSSFSPNPAIIFLSSVSHWQLLSTSGNRHWQEEQGLWLITSKLPIFKAQWHDWLCIHLRCCAYKICTPHWKHLWGSQTSLPGAPAELMSSLAFSITRWLLAQHARAVPHLKACNAHKTKAISEPQEKQINACKPHQQCLDQHPRSHSPSFPALSIIFLTVLPTKLNLPQYPLFPSYFSLLTAPDFCFSKG